MSNPTNQEEPKPTPSGWVNVLTGKPVLLDDKSKNDKCPECGSYSVISDQPSSSRCLKCGWHDD